MSERKTRAIIFLVVAIIAFVCSCVLFSMTGGVSDWFVNNETDSGFMEFNNTDYYGLTDNGDNNSDDSKDSSGFLDDLSKKDSKKSTYSSKSSSKSSSQSSSQDSSQDSGSISTYTSSDAAMDGM